MQTKLDLSGVLNREIPLKENIWEIHFVFDDDRKFPSRKSEANKEGLASSVYLAMCIVASMILLLQPLLNFSQGEVKM